MSNNTEKRWTALNTSQKVEETAIEIFNISQQIENSARVSGELLPLSLPLCKPDG